MRTSSNLTVNEKFSKYIGIMKEAFERKDFDTYDAAKAMLEEAVDESREYAILTNEVQTTNFGLLNHIIEESLPELFKNKQTELGKIIKLIKEDRNLSTQFKFYHALKHFNGDNPVEFVKESLQLVSENIDKGTVRKSNARLSRLMLENKIIPERVVNKNIKKFYEDCDYLLSRKKYITNLTEIEDRTKEVGKYINEHKITDIKENRNQTLNLIDNYEKSLNEKLTNEERSLVKDIIDFQTPGINTRKEKMFNQLKNECLTKVEDMIEENANDSKLRTLKEQISNKTFCEDTIVKDIAKLLEIRDILYAD